jgi:hypothetical protein
MFRAKVVGVSQQEISLAAWEYESIQRRGKQRVLADEQEVQAN